MKAYIGKSEAPVNIGDIRYVVEREVWTGKPTIMRKVKVIERFTAYAENEFRIMFCDTGKTGVGWKDWELFSAVEVKNM